MSTALDAHGEPFQVGDRALHINGQLDDRQVTWVGDGQIKLWLIGAEAGPFPSANYERLPKVTR